MYSKLTSMLLNDVRFIEGLNACMSCGICTAICPAAEFYDYDPRTIVTTVQSGNQQKIIDLLESDTIWYCGQCMSCKIRCPRGNFPGLLITVLRKISQETGAFTKSKKGRQQYLLKKAIGETILKYGYCVHPSMVTPENHPEQGPVWRWVFENRQDVYKVVGANLDAEGAGALRKIPTKALEELHQIFEHTGGMKLFETIDAFSSKKALELGFYDNYFNADMQAYQQFIENE